MREIVEVGSRSAITLHDCHDPRFWYPWHFHPEVEVKWVLAGRGTRYLGDSIAPFEPGDLCIVGAGTSHCWNSAPVRGQWVHARVVQFLPDVVGGSAELESITALLERAKRGLCLRGATRDAVATELDRLFSASSRARRLGHLLTALAIAAEANDNQVLSQDLPAEPHATHSLAWRVLDCLTVHSGTPLTATGMAKRFGFSPAGFSRFFTREFGKPFIRYLAEMRVGRASHLLIERETRIADIARQSGFGTVAGLNRHFRSVKGTTPTAYRRLARQMGRRLPSVNG